MKKNLSVMRNDNECKTVILAICVKLEISDKIGNLYVTAVIQKEQLDSS